MKHGNCLSPGHLSNLICRCFFFALEPFFSVRNNLKPQDSFCWWRGVFLEVAHSKGMGFAVPQLVKWQANKQPTFVDSMFIKRYSQCHVKLPSGCLCVCAFLQCLFRRVATGRLCCSVFFWQVNIAKSMLQKSFVPCAGRTSS